MGSPKKLDRYAKLYGQRSWDELRDSWVNVLPVTRLSEEPPSEPYLEELDDLQQVLSELPTSDGHKWTQVELQFDILGPVLRDAFDGIRKAAHLVHLLLTMNERGYRTWCRYIAYHAAHIAASSYLDLMGMIPVRQRSTDSWFQLDLLPLMLAGNSKGGDVLVCRRSRVAQKDRWALFLSAIHRTSGTTELLPEGLKAALKAISFDEFAAIRNNLQYRNSYWLFGDFQVPNESDVGNLVPGNLPNCSYLKVVSLPLNSNNSLWMYMSIYSLCVRFWEDISESSQPLSEDILHAAGLRDRLVNGSWFHG